MRRTPCSKHPAQDTLDCEGMRAYFHLHSPHHRAGLSVTFRSSHFLHSLSKHIYSEARTAPACLLACHGFLVSICTSSLPQGKGQEHERRAPQSGRRTALESSGPTLEQPGWACALGGPHSPHQCKSQAAFGGELLSLLQKWLVSVPHVNSDIATLESGQGMRAPGLGFRKSRKPQRGASWGRAGTKKSRELKFSSLPLTSQVTQSKYHFLSDLHKVTELY